ncbi:hypothetical protein L7F22_036987 [Adiantum nelumboides]|nr:hypothetical protein [Adiantum nelumboides]
MADNNKENRMSIDDFDFAHEDATDDTSMMVNYLVTRLHQAMGNPALQGEVQHQLHPYGILPPCQQERAPERFQGETSKRGLSTEKGVENPYQELKKLLEGKPSSKKKGHAQPERSPSREREESESDESMEDVAPRRRRAQRSPTPTKRNRSPHSPHRRESKREEKSSRKKKERKRSPSSPSSSPSSSSDEGSGYSSQEKQRRGHRRSYAAWKRSSKLKKFKEGGKKISFLTYDGTFGATDKLLAFIQQFDAAFGDEGFTESSKLRHVAMHFQKSARQWWASLRDNGEAPKTWKALRASIIKQFLASDAKDKVLTKWRSLKLSPYESIHKYVDKFWDLHLKATVYKKIDFEEQKQQFCAGLPEEMNEYANSQRPRSISAVIHHTMVAARINFQQGAKRNLKPMEAKEKQEYKGKNFSQNSSKGNSNNNKAKEKGVFKDELPPERFEDHKIDLIPGSSIPNQAAYRVNASQREEIMKQVNELLEKDTILLIVRQFCLCKRTALSACVDYRALNKGMTAVHLAVYKYETRRKLDVLELLLKSGANACLKAATPPQARKLSIIRHDVRSTSDGLMETKKISLDQKTPLLLALELKSALYLRGWEYRHWDQVLTLLANATSKHLQFKERGNHFVP